VALDMTANAAAVNAQAVNILLVDDEPNNLLALSAVLDAADRRLVTAASGMEALRHLLHEDFAVILLDVHMPTIDGFDTAELIRGRERTKDTPIIFLTAETGGQGFESRGYSLGAVDYIIKPFDAEALRAKVAVFVELFRKTCQVKQQAAELSEMTTFLNGVLESATDYAILALDPDGRFLTWNEGARRIYGYMADEMIQRRDLSMLHPALPSTDGVQRNSVDALLRTAAQHGKAEGTVQHVHKDGRAIPVAVTISRREDADGLSLGFVLVARDITEQQRAEAQQVQLIEEQAARSEAETARDRVQQVVDNLPEGIMLADGQGVIYLTNAAAKEITGVELIGSAEMVLGDQPILHLDGTPYEADEWPIVRVARQGETVRGEQLLIPNAATGQYVPALVNGAPLRDPQGTLSGGVVVFQDISAIKDLERQKDAFLAAASHDLKNPLTAIKARAQILQRQAARMAGPHNERVVDGLRAIDLTATRLTAMINELLDVARLQMGRPLLLDRQPTDLAEVARAVTSELQPSSDRHDLEIIAPPEATLGAWDRARLERVVSNLVANAMKFSPEGGRVRLVIRDEVRDNAPWVALEVHDEGVGIPADDMPRIFERFYRGSNVAGAIEGTGLGLSGARHIVEQHGGCLSVASTQGKGSVFTMLLPVREECAVSADYAEHAQPAGLAAT
jgi:PAS domain S-box-containing protein